jgi:hypothetical protein
MILNTHQTQKVFPQEATFLLFLVMGLLGSVTIAREHFVVVYQGYLSGPQAVLLGYLLAFSASFGLFNFYRRVEHYMAKIRNYSRLFWWLYALCIAMPFVCSRISILKNIEGLCLILTIGIVIIYGHIFYSRLKVGIRVQGDSVTEKNRVKSDKTGKRRNNF